MLPMVSKVAEQIELSPILHTVIVTNNCHFPHRSVVFLAGQPCNFQLFCQASLPNCVRRLNPKMDDTSKSIRQIRDIITSYRLHFVRMRLQRITRPHRHFSRFQFIHILLSFSREFL